jgi:hypothetical protein
MTPEYLITLYTAKLHTCDVILSDKCSKAIDRDIALEKKKLIEEFILYLNNLLTL